MKKEYEFNIAEVFSSIQGEGTEAGLPATFVRFSGCNMRCKFCDTDHRRTHIATMSDLVKRIVRTSNGVRLVVFTGGEPLLQPVAKLSFVLRDIGFKVGIETNGTRPCSFDDFDYISLSPKVPFAECRVSACTSLKILYPYSYLNICPGDYKKLVCTGARFIQPIDVKDPLRNKDIIKRAAHEIMRLKEGWQLGLQLHKIIGLK